MATTISITDPLSSVSPKRFSQSIKPIKPKLGKRHFLRVMQHVTSPERLLEIIFLFHSVTTLLFRLVKELLIVKIRDK